MTKGTSSFGKRRNKTHTICRRCGTVWLFKIQDITWVFSGGFPHPEEDLRLLRLPCSQDQGIQLVYQGDVWGSADEVNFEY